MSWGREITREKLTEFAASKKESKKAKKINQIKIIVLIFHFHLLILELINNYNKI